MRPEPASLAATRGAVAARPRHAAHLRRRAEVRIEPLAGADEAAVGARWWRSPTTWQVVAFCVLVPFVVSVFTVRPGYRTVWEGWFENLATAAPVIPLVLRGTRSKWNRAAWFCLAAGVCLYTVGDLVYLFHDQNLTPIPTPAWSDALYLAEYPFLGIGIVLLTQRNFGSVRASTRLDGAITGLAIASVAALLWFDQVLKVSGDPLQVATEMAYPLLDLVLLVLLVAGFAPMRYRPTRQAGFLVLGIGITVLADVTYVNQIAAGTYVQGTWLDASWAVGLWVMGLAAIPRERPPRSLRTEPAVPKGVTVVPIVFGAVSLLVLLVTLFHHASFAASSLALAALVLVVVRTAMTLHEVLDVERASYRSARVDELTGLPNRRAFFELGEAAVSRLASEHVGIVLIDLDGFKEINDSLGHAAGDQLLRAISTRLQQACRRRATVSRIGGDEFACIVPATTTMQLTQVGDAIAATINRPVELGTMSVRVGASIGLSVGPEHGTSLSELLRCADVAMYRAKLDHTMVRVFQPSDELHTRDQLQLIDDLHRTAWQDQLVLHYQPTIDVRTGYVVGVEALVRWRHERFGLLYPDDFVATVERTGLIHDLTHTVLVRALDELARLDALGHRLQMSVNVSRYDLSDDTLALFIAEHAAVRGIPPERLTLEITESSLGDEPDRAARSIDALRAMGVRCSIDDFGVGYSSMSQLLRLTVDELKIDRSFALALAGDARARAVVTATVGFARALGLQVVAEGVETLRILGIVRRLGVDVGQGYAISVPLSPGQLEAFLARPPILTVPRDLDLG